MADTPPDNPGPEIASVQDTAPIVPDIADPPTYGCEACSFAPDGCSICRPRSIFELMAESQAAEDQVQAEADAKLPQAPPEPAPVQVGPGTEVIVLLREHDSGDITVHAVLADDQALDRCMTAIAAANSEYPLRLLRPDVWRIGPDDDEGFFGHKPVYLRAVRKQVRA